MTTKDVKEDEDGRNCMCMVREEDTDISMQS